MFSKKLTAQPAYPAPDPGREREGLLAGLPTNRYVGLAAATLLFIAAAAGLVAATGNPHDGAPVVRAPIAATPGADTGWRNALSPEDANTSSVAPDGTPMMGDLGATDGQTGSIGLGFAIPINQARRVAEEIIRTGTSTHPIIGASVDASYTGPGARIATQNGLGGAAPVTPGGPAAKAGIQPGDIVLSVDGRSVDGAAELIVAIRTHAPGETVTLTVKDSAGHVRTVKVTLGSQPGT